MYKNILLPVVLGEGNAHESMFAVARKLAEPDAKFTILHVRDPIPAYVMSELPRDVLEANKREMHEELQALTAELPGATAVLATGNAGRSIVEHAGSNGVDCIIVASHKPGLQNILLGSTANRVVHHAKCAVHVIR